MDEKTKILTVVLIVVGALWLYTTTLLIEERNTLVDKYELKIYLMEERYERCLERYQTLELWLRGYHAE